MIEVKNLTKTFALSKKQQNEMRADGMGSSLDAVRNVSFQCAPGRIFTLLGPNGAGKTTTLRMIATILKPSSGTITVAGYDVVHQDVEVRRRLGFLTGSTGLYDRLTPNEMITYFGKLSGMPDDLIEKRKNALFDRLDIHPFANRRIAKFSTGMKQKVSIVRTMIHDPEVVVFDEPTSGLDVITAKNIIQLIRDCRDQNKTVIFSTHIMSEVNMLSDDLAIIHKGDLIYNNTFAKFKSEMQENTLEDEFIRMAADYEKTLQ